MAGAGARVMIANGERSEVQRSEIADHPDYSGVMLRHDGFFAIYSHSQGLSCGPLTADELRWFSAEALRIAALLEACGVAALGRDCGARMMTTATAERTFSATISTAARVRRDGLRPDHSWGPWTEILDPNGADLHRLPGVPLLLDHLARTDFQVGVIETAKVERGAVTATVRFGTDPRAQRIAEDVRDKIRRQLSVGYAVSEWRREGDRKDAAPVFTAVKWVPMEVSVVALGADTGATFRSEQPEQLRTRAMTVTSSPSSGKGLRPARA